jgi:hypothetical protein
MPDFEIRYFYADGSLAVVHVTTHAFMADAEGHAKLHQGEYAHFTVEETKGMP